MLTRIVTCYRQWPEIHRWIQHSNLFVRDVDWIIVNDAPTDPCPSDLLSMLEQRQVRIVQPLFNSGRSNARNLGAAAASSAWIEHIDGDDVPLPLDPGLFPDPATADLLAFPVFEENSQTSVEEKHPTSMDIIPSWTGILKHLHPIDVRPSGTVWNRESFLRIGGYDARFESAEDLHLAIRAEIARLKTARFDRPKQIYNLTAGNYNFDALHIQGHLRVWEWVLAHGSDTMRQEAKRWLGKEVLYNAGLANSTLARQSSNVLSYLGWRTGLIASEKTSTTQ